MARRERKRGWRQQRATTTDPSDVGPLGPAEPEASLTPGKRHQGTLGLCDRRPSRADESTHTHNPAAQPVESPVSRPREGCELSQGRHSARTLTSVTRLRTSKKGHPARRPRTEAFCWVYQTPGDAVRACCRPQVSPLQREGATRRPSRSGHSGARPAPVPVWPEGAARGRGPAGRCWMPPIRSPSP